jgi:probable rRNA maturation factor
MVELYIENNQKLEKVTDELQQLIEAVCEAVLEEEKCDFTAQVSVTLTDNQQIWQLNREYRGKDMPTDVLSFPMLEFDEDGDIIDDGAVYSGDVIVLGDIVISLERARSQAQEFGHRFEREVAFLTAHSMLHLLGYDHVDDPEGELLMNEKQERVLSGLGLARISST